MKKIIAFALSASMCLSLLTVLTPAFAYERDGQQTIQTRAGDTDRKPDPDRKPISGQNLSFCVSGNYHRTICSFYFW